MPFAMSPTLQPRRSKGQRHGLALVIATATATVATLTGGIARAEVQLRCQGTLLEARGQAEIQRPTSALGVSLGVEAEAAQADRALEQLQGRLAAVRGQLQALGVKDLRVGAPSTWERSGDRGQRPSVQASLQVNGRIDPDQFQALISKVAGLPGVRLAPVNAETDPRQDSAIRTQLLQAAYQDALNQAREVAAAIGRRRQLSPLEVQLDGNGDLRPMPMAMRAAAPAPAPPPFTAAELPKPTQRLSLLARFCAL
jgi:uncharacterized protein YggE